MTARLPAGASSGYLKSCCADLWAHPGVRLLAGDALHPGGRELTVRTLELLELSPGSVVLDLGSGPGATRDVAASFGLRPVALDLASVASDLGRAGWFVVGDAERSPFATAAFDGAVAECVLSLVPDKESALRELRRVLRPEGRLAISDVTSEGPLPVELESLLGWIACAGGARPLAESCDRLEAAGFRVLHAESRTTDLAAMISRARRRLALLQGAVLTGLVDTQTAGVPSNLLELGQRLLGLAAQATRDGVLGYGLIVAG